MTILTLQRPWVDDMHGLSDVCDNTELGDVAHLLGRLLRKAHNVILSNTYIHSKDCRSSYSNFSLKPVIRYNEAVKLKLYHCGLKQSQKKFSAMQ